MNMSNIKRLALAFALSLAACGGTVDEPNAGADAGTQNGTDAGEVVNTGGLTINVPLGISLIDVPAIGFDAVDGEIEVKRNGDVITTATVTINGVTIDPVEVADWYSVAADVGEIPDAEAGKTLRIVARDGNDTVELNLPCPTEVAFTSPAENSQITAGQQIEFTWSGKVGPYVSDFHDPYLQLWGNEPVTAGDHPYSLGMPKQGENYLSLEDSDTTGTLTLPSELSYSDYLARLYVPGDEVKSGSDDFGYCKLVRTLHLTKQ